MLRPIVWSIVFFCLMLNISCRSTVQKPSEKPNINQYGQLETLTRDEPDSRGIITYDTYQILIASGNETIAQISERLGIAPEKLALYNGLIPNYRPREREMIALPEDQFKGKSGWSTEITSTAIEKSNDTKIKISSADNPLRHRIKEGDTVYSIAREYNVSVNAIATWNGLGPDLDIKLGREIIIPATMGTASKTNTEKKPSSKLIKKVKDSKLVVKQDVSSEENFEKSQKTESEAELDTLPSVDIISVKPFIAPVKGTIVSKYNQAQGSQNNNGIDYETAIGAVVKVVSDGDVVLISDIVGGNGKIILIKHNNDLITIYGRLMNINVEKGQEVIQGQKIGEVTKDSDNNRGLIHFEVRKGMKSIDPETMIR